MEGLVKAANKAKKNAVLFGIKPEDAGKKHANTPESDRVKAHKAKRGIKTKQQFAEHAQDIGNVIFEGLVKARNKEHKKYREEKIGLVTLSGKEPNKRTDTAFNKEFKRGKDSGLAVRAAARAHARESIERLTSMLIESLAKNILAEGVTDTDDDSISNAGGSAETYRRIKAQKAAKASGQSHTTRASALGKMGGFKDKKGQSYKKAPTHGTEKFRGTGDQTKPLPLNLKGKPGAGKKVNPSAVRGKSVNTSRSTGEEGNKADAHSRAFNTLMTNLHKSKKGN